MGPAENELSPASPVTSPATKCNTPFFWPRCPTPILKRCVILVSFSGVSLKALYLWGRGSLCFCPVPQPFCTEREGQGKARIVF